MQGSYMGLGLQAMSAQSYQGHLLRQAQAQQNAINCYPQGLLGGASLRQEEKVSTEHEKLILLLEE